jgi:hypothetical protein
VNAIRANYFDSRCREAITRADRAIKSEVPFFTGRAVAFHAMSKLPPVAAGIVWQLNQTQGSNPKFHELCAALSK